MRSRRSGRSHLSDIFYNVGDMNPGSVDDRFGFIREFTDATQDGMLREERLEREHRMEEERRREAQYPSCRMTDRPAGWYFDRSRLPRTGYDRDRPSRDYPERPPRGYYDEDMPSRW